MFFFFKFSAKRVLCALQQIFNTVHRVKDIELGHRIGLVEFLLLKQVFGNI